MRLSVSVGGPAAGDAGGAIGAALSTWYHHHNKERVFCKENDGMKGAYLGPLFTDSEIEAELTACGASFVKLSENELIEKVALELNTTPAPQWACLSEDPGLELCEISLVFCTCGSLNRV